MTSCSDSYCECFDHPRCGDSTIKKIIVEAERRMIEKAIKTISDQKGNPDKFERKADKDLTKLINEFVDSLISKISELKP